MADVFYDQRAVNIACEFAESMVLTKSTKSGRPEKLTLLPHTRKLLANLYGWRRDVGVRLIRKVYFGLGRKNAKTQIAALIALLELFLTDEMSPEIYMAAKDRDQASVCFQAAADMINAHDELRELAIITPSRKTIHNPVNNGLIKALSSEGRSKHGLNPSVVIFDELHAWTPAEQELYDALTTGSGARKNPLQIITTTAGTEQQSICYREYEYAQRVAAGIVEDPTYLPLIYEVPADADWTDESLWSLANPALGSILSLADLREHRDKALEQPSEQNKFRRLYLNQWVNAETQWISLKEWDACKVDGCTDRLDGRECYGGLDLSATTDLTAFVLAFPDKGGVILKPMFWVPAEGLAEKSKRDRVPYDVWVKQGWIRTTPGKAIDYSFITHQILQDAKRYNLRRVAYDRWGMDSIFSAFESSNIEMAKFGQGHGSMSTPSKQFEISILRRQLKHDGNPVLRWNLDCTTTESDAAGGIKPVKPHRERSSKRIDGVVASIMAMAQVDIGDKTPNPYATRGFVTI